MKIDKILIVNTFGIGDVLHTIPLLASLHRAYPASVIDCLVNRRVASFLGKNQSIRQCLVYERDEFVVEYKKSPIAYWRKWIDLFKCIRGESYDVVFDLSMNRNINVFLGLTGIPKRIGYNYKNRGQFLTHGVAFKGFEHQHVADYFLDLLKPLGIPPTVRKLDLAIDADDERWAQAWLSQQGLSSHQCIALLPGGGTSWGKNALFRRWSPSHFAQLADKVIAKSGTQLILMGDPTERSLCEEIVALMQQPAYIAAGDTNITQLSALLRHCRLAISNDGGPLHIAVASGVKTCSIFGPVNPEIYGPFPPEQHRVIQKNLPCQPCYRRFRMPACQHMSCLHTLTVNEVMKEVEKEL